MIGISWLRVLRGALQNFWRNIWLSLATTLIMTITLLMMSMLYFGTVFSTAVLRAIEQKVDLSVTFKPSVTAEQLTAIAEEMRTRSDVEEVRVISSEEALTLFRERHQDQPFIEASLRELEDNPLPASMFVVATEPRFYQGIARHLQAEKYTPFIEQVNFENSRLVIDRLISVMSTARNVGLAVTAIFSTLVVLIMFNTVRLAIYSFREEVDIMRLVGASAWFIQGPFIFEAIIVALLAVAISTAFLFPSLKAAAPYLQQFFFDAQSQFNIYQYALRNWTTVIGLQALLAVGLASGSSFFAIRRYLRT